MIPQLSSNTETNIKLPFSFIFYSLIAFMSSQFILLFENASIISGVFRTPEIWSGAHFLLIGWALMVAMGAMYQLVPVVFLSPIWSEKLGFLQFVVTAIGITSFALSFVFYPGYIFITGIITLVGILLFIFQMVMTIKVQPKKNIMTLFVGSALFCLIITIILGISMAMNMNHLINLNNHIALLKSHILFGITGWFTLLIFGFSYKMVPMFSLSHGFSMKLSPFVYIVYVTGLLAIAISFFLENSVLLNIGIALLFGGFTLFLINMQQVLKKRLKKKLDHAFSFSVLAIYIGWAIHLLAFITVFIPAIQGEMLLKLTYLYVLGWIIFSIIGYLYKIVPFLWWTHRYSKLIGKDNVPTLKEMMNENLGFYLFRLFFICFIGISIALFTNIQIIFVVSQGLLSIVSIVFCFLIFSVLKK